MIKKSLLAILIILFFVSQFLFSESAIDYYKIGKEEYFNENYDNAIFNLKKSLELNPNYVDALLELSYLYYDIENYDYAYKYINKALNLMPKNEELTVFSADIEAKLKLFQSAEKKYREVINSNPLNLKAQSGMANLYLETNKKSMAKSTLDNILKADPNNFDAYIMTARYYESFDKKKADDYYLSNIEKNSLNPDSFFYYSIFNYKNNRASDAINNILTAISIKPKTLYKKYYGKYLLYLNKGDEALSNFREILKNEKNNYITFYYLAYCYNMISDYDKAVESLKRVMNLREDDELSLYYLNSILINNYDTDDSKRISHADKIYEKARRAKNDSLYDIYISLLKETLFVYPKHIKARLDLADYFLSLNLPERYINELKLAYKYSKDKNILDKIEVEKKRISYRLGDDWSVNQYNVETNIFHIPLFIHRNIENIHFDCEKIYSYILKNCFNEKMKYDILVYNDKEYSTAEKMQIASSVNSPFYINLNIDESNTSILSNLDLYNANNNELIKRYRSNKNGNDKIISSSLELLDKLNSDMMFKANIIKKSKDRAIINAGKRLGIKLKDKFVILANKYYNIEFNRSVYVYNSSDIKGYGIVVKLDENICEIKFIDSDYFKDIDVDDIVIYK
jgi:tetratricopeptide (TPR) repeat protein